ncbi:hypothetical protein OSB04_029901 [Centaurea solstitialis]|uniref:Vacuolar protein sorting-associated protein 62 n=1 Tax=Centaurea solstitialis TaxID=347529 RepID=A0AA38SE40_9ASTR|nr:hypothetical protein OSB04_029901 [Centaurea solstitialis]
MLHLASDPTRGLQAGRLRHHGLAAKTLPDSIRCVRSDLTEECETDALVWGSKDVNVYGLRPKVRERLAQGVSVGTFVVLKTEDDSGLLPLSCLRNGNFDKLESWMPNVSQVETLIREYSPRNLLSGFDELVFCQWGSIVPRGRRIEPYFGRAHRVEPPQGGSNDGTYWLDLPVDETEKERVKKGDLQNCEGYVHVKPMLGATFTDLAVWIFYPFNGPSTARFGLIDIPLGRIGEHIGDWEHVTLRVSNFDGLLYRVYFAQHSGGTWVDTPALEFLDSSNNFAAYPSLNGHATYPGEGVEMQGTDVIGLENDAAKSDNFFDVKDRHSIMAAEYIGDVIELPWVNYARKWGPKITYEIGTEIEKLQSSLTGPVGSAVGSLVGIIPREFSSEDGPTGPKMKVDWDGDER